MTKSILTQMEAWTESTSFDDSFSIDDTTSFEETADANSLVKLFFGDIAWSMEVINQLSLTDNGYILCSGYYTQWEGFNELQVLNNTYITNENIIFNEASSISQLFNSACGLTIIDIPLDKIVLGNNNTIGAKTFLENQTL